jgi:hypothetical protein
LPRPSIFAMTRALSTCAYVWRHGLWILSMWTPGIGIMRLSDRCEDQVPQHPPPLPRRPAPRLAQDAGAQPPRRRHAPRAPAARYPTRPGYDRDEYPPAVGRGRGKGLRRGTHPRGWKADLRYIPSAENRSHGSTLGIKLRRFCDGTRFRYVFY